MVRGRKVAVLASRDWKLAEYAMYHVGKAGGLGLLLQLNHESNSVSNVQAIVDAVQRFGAQVVVGVGSDPGVMDAGRAAAMLCSNPEAVARLEDAAPDLDGPRFESLPFCAIPVLPTGNECSNHAWVVSAGQTRLDLGAASLDSVAKALADPFAVASKLGVRELDSMAISVAGVLVQAAEQASSQGASGEDKLVAIHAVAGAGAALLGLCRHAENPPQSSPGLAACLELAMDASFASSALKDRLQGGIAAALVGGAVARYSLDPMHLTAMAGPHAADLALELLEDAEDEELEGWAAVTGCIDALRHDTGDHADLRGWAKRAALQGAAPGQSPREQAERAGSAITALFEVHPAILQPNDDWEFSQMDIDNIATGAEAEACLASRAQYVTRAQLKDIATNIFRV